MAVWGRSPLVVAILLWMHFGRAAEKGRSASQCGHLAFNMSVYSALTEPQICYVLDGILFLYGIILTALYCRLKITNAKKAAAEKAKAKKNVEEGIYTGLTPRNVDTYETIGIKK